MNLVLGLSLLLFLLPSPAGSPDVATVTLIEGPLRVIRSAAMFQFAEGVRLRPGDILETSDKGFAQLEFAKGTIVALGPSTRAYVMGRGAGTQLVMLGGWLKAECKPASGAFRFDTPLLGVTATDGTVVLHAAPGSAEIFVEAGAASIAHTTPAKAGQFFVRRAGKGMTSAPRPDSGFLESMPRPFRDTFPSRLARFAGKTVEPRRDHDVSYEEVQPWLTMERGWRRGFVERFRSRLSDPAFRHAVDAHMGEHMEWDPVLHPEKYQPKTPPEGTDKRDNSPGGY